MIIPVTIGATGVVTKLLKETFGSHVRKTCNRFPETDNYAWNITHIAISTVL